ncbi:MAG: hypothetical protein KDI30_09525, partial [Pseudomonadales bacterium]|nr:hypothetical protein [Pseudomonadales bacterium]
TVDETRATLSHGDYKCDPVRRFEGKVWYPTNVTEGPYPLIVYSHGFMSFHQEGEYIARFMASHGYVVAAADFPSTNYFAPGGPDLKDVVNQPGDVSFIIDYILSMNDDSTSILAGKIDAERIAAVGLSLGGMTTELVTFHPDLGDKRIKAAVSIAGPSAMFTERFFTFTDVPFMMIAGDIDAMVPYKKNAAPITQKDRDSILVTIRGGSHTGFAGIASILFRWIDNPDTVGCSSIKKNIPRNVEDNFLTPLGGEEKGVIVLDRSLPCEVSPLPKAIAPADQQMITTLAIYSCLQSHFLEDAAKRQDFKTYLLYYLGEENSRVTVTFNEQLVGKLAGH